MAALADRFRVEIAFTSDPDAAAPAWVDVSSYVQAQQPMTITRGRQDEFATVQAGTLSGLVLDNTDGRFTPGLTTSPFYPNVTLRRRIRVSYLPPSAAADSRFTGYVDSWVPSWPGGGQESSTVAVTASDRLKWNSVGPDLPSPLALQIGSMGPCAYYPLTEPSGSDSAGDVTGRQRATLLPRSWPTSTGGAVTFASGVAVPGDAGPGVQFAPDIHTGGGMMLSARSRRTSDPTGQLGALFYDPTQSYAWHAIVTTTATVDQPIMSVVCGFTGQAWNDHALILTMDGATGLLALALLVNNPSTGGLTQQAVGGTTDRAINDGQPHSCMVIASSNGAASPTVTWTIWVDGVQVGSFTQTFVTNLPPHGPSEDPGGMWLLPGGNPIGPLPGLVVAPFTGSLSHIALWDIPLTAGTEAATIAAAALTAWSPESSAARATRITQLAGLGGALTVTGAGQERMGVVDTTGKSLVEVLQTIADTEVGVLVVDRTGQIVLQDRTQRYNVTPSLVVDASQVDPGLTFPLDEQYLVNDVTVVRQGGATTRTVDQTSYQAFGSHPVQRTLYVADDTAAEGLGAYLLGLRSQPTPRPPSLVIDLNAISSNPPGTYRALDVSSVIEVTGLPSQAPAPTLDFFVEGVVETIAADAWSLSLNTSPVVPAVQQGIYVLNQTGASELDSTVILGY